MPCPLDQLRPQRLLEKVAMIAIKGDLPLLFDRLDMTQCIQHKEVLVLLQIPANAAIAGDQTTYRQSGTVSVSMPGVMELNISTFDWPGPRHYLTAADGSQVRWQMDVPTDYSNQISLNPSQLGLTVPFWTITCVHEMDCYCTSNAKELSRGEPYLLQNFGQTFTSLNLRCPGHQNKHVIF